MSNGFGILGRVAALCAALVLPHAAPPPTEPFALAVVREDGILVPFARFDGSTWVRIWVEFAERVDTPASLESVPPQWFPPDGKLPETWSLWSIRDVRASPFETRAGLPVTPQKPVSFAAHCLQGVGVQTDYEGPDDRQIAPNTHPKPKAGLALTTPAVRVDRATVLEPASPLAKWAEDRALLPFHRNEDDYLENLEPSERPRFGSFAARRSTPVRWTRVLRLGTAQARERTYYLEGEVAYSPLTIMVGHVWLQVAGEREVTDAEVTQTDEDHKHSVSREPLGIIRVGDRRFWVFESHGYESEAFEIFEVSDVSRTPVSVLTVPAGGC